YLNFGRVHNAYKNSLMQPYFFLTGDRKNAGLYVLYRKEDKIEDLIFDFLQNDKLESSLVKFEDIPLHLLLKILAANYFETRKETVSHNKFYVQAKSGKGKTIICVEIEIKGAMENIDDNGNEHDIQQFKILNHATHFSPRVPWGTKAITAAKFKKIVRSGSVYFRQLKPKEADNFEGDVYYIDREPNRRAVLDYHSASEPESTRGYILHQFIKKFIPYLQKYGIVATQNTRIFFEYSPQIKSDNLQISDLKTVYLFDNRLNTKDIPIQDYALLLNEKYHQELSLTFEVIEEKQFDTGKPLLILQDNNKKDFEADGPLPRSGGWDDPYRRIYKIYSNIPKQSININLNNPDQYNAQAATQYLQYDLVNFEREPQFDQRFQVCFNELYLKDLLLNQRDVSRLPCLGSDSFVRDYAFIRRETQNGKSYTTLLYIHNGKLRLIDLRGPAGKSLRDELFQEYEIDWFADALTPFKVKHKREDWEEKRITRFDFIIGPNQVIEIEDIDERVLYDYEAILDRKRELEKPYPIEELKLAKHYDKIRPKKINEASITLEQCQAYDAFLDNLIRAGISRISFNELTQQEAYWQPIIEALEIKPTNSGKYYTTKLKTHCYNKIGMFLSTKATDVTQGYSGIWYDDENCFMVGDAKNFKFKQPRAHLIRRFNVYKGEELFDIDTFLDTTAVKFVRFNQFTVYPYFFHLIDMYVEAKLFY
ncbi:MAG: hypothetical protein KDJ97_24080, partial [Anaerolineae bacterium]|nr:hypothetical protein [Anaerolineae bacterium]